MKSKNRREIFLCEKEKKKSKDKEKDKENENRKREYRNLKPKRSSKIRTSLAPWNKIKKVNKFKRDFE